MRTQNQTNMKRLFIATMLLALSVSAMSQTKVKEKDILGQWKLVINVDRDDIERDLEDEHWLARRFARSVSNFALDIVEGIDVRMDFREDGEVKIRVEVMGIRETEYAEWYINRDGALVIDDDDRRGRRRDIHIGDNDAWMMDGDRLVAVDHRGRKTRDNDAEVYMVKR